MNDPLTKSPDVNRNWMNRRTSSVIGPIKEMEKDNDDDFNDNNANSFVPSLSNNSRVNLILKFEFLKL